MARCAAASAAAKPAAAAALAAATDAAAGQAVAEVAAAAGTQPRPQWRKVLYEQQPFADSYTGEHFLQDLVVNATVPHRNYGTVVWSALVVDQQLSTVAAVGSASYHLYQGTVTARQLLLVDVLLALLGALLYLASSAWAAAAAAAGAAHGAAAAAGAAAGTSARAGGSWQSPLATRKHKGDGRDTTQAGPSPAKQQPPSPQQQRGHKYRGSHSSSGAGWPLSWQAAAEGVGSMAALAAATALLSPLLGTLTETVSSDSIIACACLLLLVHLYLHDYHFTAALTAHLSGSLALGCAVCGSVLIASRLGDALAVYAQLLLSLELYILGPYCRRQVAAAAPAAHLALTAAMVAAAAALLVRQSILMTSSFCCSLLFITFICPMWLVRIHKFKAQINGPWDEAVPHLSRHLSRR